MATIPSQAEDSANLCREEPYQVPTFSVEASAIDSDSPVVIVHGEVDMATAPELSGVVTKILENSPSGLAFDLRDVTFMDSSGLKVLVYARRGLPEMSPLVLRRPQPMVREVLKITHLDDLCVIED